MITYLERIGAVLHPRRRALLIGAAGAFALMCGSLVDAREPPHSDDLLLFRLGFVAFIWSWGLYCAADWFGPREAHGQQTLLVRLRGVLRSPAVRNFCAVFLLMWFSFAIFATILAGGGCMAG